MFVWKGLLLGLLLAANETQEPPKPGVEKPPVEGRVAGCFGVNEVIDTHTNTYVLELINNTAEDVEATVETSGATIVRRNVDLPRRSRQRFFIYVPVPPGGAQAYADFIVTDRGTGVEYWRDRAMANSIGDEASYKILVLTSGQVQRSAFDLPIGATRRGNSVRVATAECRPANLPDAWIGLKGFDAIVLYDYPTADLTPDQRKSILDWVTAGGRLITIPTMDPAALQTSFFRTLYPFQIDAPTFDREHAGLSGYFSNLPAQQPFAFYPVTGAPGQVFSGIEGGPVIAHQPHGFGDAYLFAFDLMQSPFAEDRDGKGRMWDEVFIHATHRTLRPLRIDPSEIPGVTGLVVPPPPILTVMIILVLFILLVGPVNYFIFFQKRRPILTVLSIPAISILFAGIILLMGVVFRSERQFANNIVLLQSRSGEARAFESRLVSLFSPVHGSYDFEFLDGTYALPGDMTDVDPYTGQVLPTDLELEQREKGYAVNQLKLLRFEGELFKGSAVRSLGGGISYNGDRLINGSRYRILRAAYVDKRAGLLTTFLSASPGKGVRAKRIRPLASTGFAEHFAGEDPFLREIAGAVYNRSSGSALFCLLEEDPGTVRINGQPPDRDRTVVLLRIRK